MYNSHDPEKKTRKIGVVVCLAVLGFFEAVVVACGVGKAHVNRQDVGASGLETKAVAAERGDGMEDVAELHLREDLLLENYSWVDPSASGADAKVRIPIDRAMELLVQRGLPVAAPAVRPTAPMSEDQKPKIVVPLTNGFALTSHDLDQTAVRDREPRR